MAEVIKTGILKGREVLELISDYLNTRNCDTLEDIIFKCICTKGEYVSEDEFDTGKRKLLNLGHTIGHAIEKCTGYGITHGEAVAIGINLITDMSEKHEGLPEEERNLIRNILIKTALQLEIPSNISLENLMDAILLDKKIKNDDIDAIMIKRIGECCIKRMAVDDLKSYLKYYME